MKENFIESERITQTGFVRLGGALIIMGLIIHIIANMVLKTFPSENLTLSELQMYLSDEKGTWAIVHGMRYIAIVCIIIFSAGLFVKTCRTRTSLSLGWGIVGLLGTALMMTNLMITNGIEILAFYDFNRLSGQKELFWLLFSLTRVLFTTEIVAWAILILGFSMAGWLSATIPKWLAILGLFCAATCMLSAVFIISILTEGWASVLIEVGSLIGLLWFVCVGFYMLRRTQ
jgi:hypothetical protein